MKFAIFYQFWRVRAVVCAPSGQQIAIYSGVTQLHEPQNGVCTYEHLELEFHIASWDPQ